MAKSGRSKKQSMAQMVKANTLWVYIGLASLASLLYLNTLNHGFVQDDAIVISSNMFTQQGLQGIPGLLQNDTFFGFFKTEGKSRLVAGGRYRPLTPVMFAVEYALVGPKPWLGHLVNLLIYALTGVLLFQLVTALVSQTSVKGQAELFALLTAVLYLCHPIHTEAVANIKGRDEMMTMLLSCTALLATLKMSEKFSWKYATLSAAALFLALMSKENAITFLGVVPLACYVFRPKMKPAAIGIVTIPLVLAAAVFLLIRGSIIGWGLGDPPMELMNNPFLKVEGGRYVAMSFAEKSATIVYTLGKYLQLLFVPYPLTHDYYPRHVEMMRWFDWQVIASALSYVVLATAGIWGLLKRKIWAFGILFYLMTLSIVSNIVFPVGTNMSERFLYMPSFGWAFVIAYGLLVLSKKTRRVFIATTAVIVVTFSILTIMRNPVWKSNNTLFLTDIQTSSNSAKLLAACAGELVSTASDIEDDAARRAQLLKGIEYIDRAQEIHPNYRMTYLLQGNAYYFLDDWDNAIKSYQSVLRIDPGNAQASQNLGIAYRDAGKYIGQTEGDIPRSIAYLEQAVNLIPTDYEAVHSLGVAYGIARRESEAIDMFKRGVELMPNNATAHFNLGLAYQRVGDLENAQKHREIAVSIDPSILERRSLNNR